MHKPLTPPPAPHRDDYNDIDVAYRYFAVIPVQNGVNYLDMYYPDWYKRVDLRTFNMRYTNADILSQVYGTDVRDTPEYKEWSSKSLIAHGFYLSDSVHVDYDTLTLRWRTVIDARLTRGPR